MTRIETLIENIKHEHRYNDVWVADLAGFYTS